MKSEGLTTTRLAEILEIKPSAVSHLVSGRNNPSYDLLQKILRRFPRISPDWLLLDSGEPYRKDEEIFEDVDDQMQPQENPEGDQIPFGIAGAQVNAVVDTAQSDTAHSIFNAFQPSSKGTKSPIFVVLFYDDGSCESFSMRK